MWLPLINMFQPFGDLFTCCSKAAVFCWYLFVCVSHLSSLCCIVCYLQLYDHLLGKDCPLDSLAYDATFCFSFPYGVSGNVWY